MISKKNSARALLIIALILALMLALFAQRRTARVETTIAEIDAGETASVTAKSTPAVSETATWSPKTQKDLQVLTEIMTSRNDNDPRMDSDLRGLTHETKAAFRLKYDSLPAESRNARGMIVFLLGREVADADDLRFLGKVLQEPACHSFNDCAVSSTASFNKDEEDHHAGMGAALAYPQLVAVKSVERILDKKNQHPEALINEALDILKAAQSSTVSEVREAATRVQEKN